MKKLLLLNVLLLTVSCLPAQTLFTYGRHKVDKEEFLRAFARNNEGEFDKQSVGDYLDLFISFKLKVQAAKDAGMDTLPAQKNELLNFRRQIEADYLTDKKIIQSLASEAFRRSLKDIRISHIFIPFDLNQSSLAEKGDTAAAYERIRNAYAALKNGQDFSETALKYSLDPAVQLNRGDIGYITIFSLPYELESIAYALHGGGFSDPYKSKVGYHIFKKTGERKAIGKISAAQILLAYGPSSTPEEKRGQKNLADSLYRTIRQGADFFTLAKQFSSERNAYATGGIMPDFGVGRYDPVFENAVFSLQNDGDITTPFETGFGVHIVKRIKRTPVVTDSTQALPLLKDEVMQDSRVAFARDRFAQNIIREVNYRKRFFKDPVLWQVSDSFLWHDNFISREDITEGTILFSLDNEPTTVADWLGFLRSVKNKYLLPFPYADLMKQFVTATATSYYQNNLEKYNPDFRSQLRDFSEGNLLFEIMDREIWSKAAKDNNGLRLYYERHKQKYVWGPGAGAIFFTTADRATAEEVSANIAGYSRRWKTLGESSSGKIIADSARFELAQIPGAGQNLTPGFVTKLITDSTNGATSFMYILNVYQQPAQKNFDEARGLVINDYQNMLEEEWVKRLKKKYPVKINEKVLHTLTR